MGRFMFVGKNRVISWAQVRGEAPGRCAGYEARAAGRARAVALMADGVARSIHGIAFEAHCETREAAVAMRQVHAKRLAGGLYQIEKAEALA